MTCHRLIVLAAALSTLVFAAPSGAQPPATPTPAALELQEGREVAKWTFDEDERSETKTRTFEATPPLKDDQFANITVAVLNDVENEDGRSVPEKNLTVTPKPTGPVDARDLRVDLSFNSADVAAGRYTGVVKAKGAPVSPSTFTILATIRDSMLKAFIWALIGFLVGLGLKAFADVSAARKKNNATGAWRPYWRRYARDSAFWTNVLFGSVSAAIATALAYSNNPVWGAGDGDDLRLAGLALLSVAGGATLSDVIRPFQPEPQTVR